MTLLTDSRVSERLRVGGLWTATMFLYVYGDIFDLYRASTQKRLLAGRSPLGPMDDKVLSAFAALMAVLSLVMPLTLLLPPGVTRWLNVVTLAVAWTALFWRRQPG